MVPAGTSPGVPGAVGSLAACRRTPWRPSRVQGGTFLSCVEKGVYMARVNVYLPDELVAEARAAGLNLSMVTRVAVHRELARSRTAGWLARVALERPGGIAHEAALAALRGPDWHWAER